MAKCACCGKGVTFGIKVSHSHRRSNRTWNPNVKRVKAVVDGSPKYIYACTRCLRSGKVTRAVLSRRKKLPVTVGGRHFCVLFIIIGVLIGTQGIQACVMIPQLGVDITEQDDWVSWQHSNLLRRI